MKKTEQYLIIGYGFLGKNLAVRLQKKPLFLASRSVKLEPESQSCAGKRMKFDLGKPSSWSCLDEINPEMSSSVFFLLPPGKVDVQLFKQLIEKLKHWNIAKAIMTSSTVVYGQSVREVNEVSAVQADSDRAKRQLLLEQCWSRMGDSVSIVRLAGLYGPGRIIGQKAIQNQTRLASNPNAHLNLIHVDDAADLLVAIDAQQKVKQVYLGCDSMPVKRSDYYDFLAQQLRCPKPVFEWEKETAVADRICQNRDTREALGWSPNYPDYKSGIRQCLSIQDEA